MGRLLKAGELRKLIFGNPSLQLGDKTISINEVTKAIYNNLEIRKRLSEKQYKKVLNQADNAKADYANYGCYGTGDNQIFYAVEFYKFVTDDKNDDYLYIIVAKPFTCELHGGNTVDDVIVEYNGEVETDYFLGSYMDFVSKETVEICGKQIKLIKDIPIDTTPEKFYINFQNKY